MTTLKIICFSWLLLFSTVAFSGGNVVGNGGDPFVAEFKGIARDILKQLKVGALPIKVINAEDFETIINETFVSSQDQLFLWNDILGKNIEVDAINYFPNHKWIEISRTRWIALKSLERRYNLVLHEYLVIMGLPDKNNEISSKYRVGKAQPLVYTW